MKRMAQFILDMLRTFKEPKRAAGSVGASGGVLMVLWWVNGELAQVRADVTTKHETVVAKIQSFNDNQTKILTALASINTGMGYLKEGVDETKRKIERTRIKVSEMAETVAAIEKSNN